MTIGFIGLGAMGRPMALHLLRHGYPLAVYDLWPQNADGVVAAGAVQCANATEVGAVSDVVITMVTTTGDVEQALLGPNGAANSAKPGTVFIDMSTILPSAAVRIGAALRAHNLSFLDAPVSGGPGGAENATLTIMVGGDISVLEGVRPILACLGASIVHMGRIGAGQITKACNQLMLLVTAEGVAEGLALAVRSGVDPALVRQALLGGLAASRVLELFGERMIARRFEAGIPLRLYDKDLGFVLETARQSGQVLPAASLVMSHIKMLAEAGDGDKDLAVLLQLVERMPSASVREVQP